MAFNYLNDFNERWITDKIDESGIQFLEKFGLLLCDKASTQDRFPGYNGVTTSQLRNIFSEVKRIELKMGDDDNNVAVDWKTDALMLRPKIAYNTARTIGRTKGSRMRELREILELALKIVSEKNHFRNFSKFFEGIIAYHKVYGGKD
jgi:CRISPR-associated protein Csm2